MKRIDFDGALVMPLLDDRPSPFHRDCEMDAQ
jgi:hypothetical protein